MSKRCWSSKATKLDNLPIRTKESMRYRISHQFYWDWVDSRSYSTEDIFKRVLNYFIRITNKFINKPVDGLLMAIRKHEFYKKQFTRNLLIDFINELNSKDGYESYSHRIRLNVVDGILIKSPYSVNNTRWIRDKIEPPKDYEYLHPDGYKLLVRNGIHFGLFSNRRVKRHYSQVDYIDEDGQPVWETWYVMEPVWEQLSTKQLRKLNLINLT